MKEQAMEAGLDGLKKQILQNPKVFTRDGASDKLFRVLRTMQQQGTDKLLVFS